MSPTRKILTRSLSAVSDAGTRVVSNTLGFVGRRKSGGKRTSSEEGTEVGDDFMGGDGDPAAFLSTSDDQTTLSPSNYTPSAGCRQGGYFDGVDYGIPQVEDPTAEVDDDFEDESFEDIARELPDLLADSPTPSSVIGGRLKKWKSRISSTLRSSTVKSASPESSPSSGSSLTSLPAIDEEVPQITRHSYASDATTGTLARYLARRHSHTKAIEQTLGRATGMSILAYEREGSWLINHEHFGEEGDPTFICPFPQCEAHYGSCGRNSGIPPHSWHKQLHPHAEALFED